MKIPHLASALATVVALSSVAAGQQVYTYDDGDTENALNFTGVTDVGMIHAFQASAAGEVVTELRVAVGTALATPGGMDGLTLTLAVWDDPVGSGDPNNAVLLGTVDAVVSQSNTDIKVAYPIAPGIPVSGAFFVGAIVVNAPATSFPVGLDFSGQDAGETAYAFGNAGPIDLVNVSGNSAGPSFQSNAVFLLDAVTLAAGPLGTNYCGPAVPNSTGLSAAISAEGDSSAATNNVTLSASGLPFNQFGIFINSTTSGFIANPGGSLGNLCVTGSIGRYNGAGQLQNSGTTGTFSLALDLTQTPTPIGNVAIAAGETWFFQTWYRDFITGQGPTSNFSDGIEIAFD